MATYYVGIGGNDSNDGTSWSSRKLTLNGAEDIPVAAGDTVYVGPGTYREMLTCDVSGSSGSPISYIGDYDGSHTDGVGGVVRITGSDNDLASARNRCILANKDYRTFIGFTLDSNDPNYGLIYTADYDNIGLTVERCALYSQSHCIKNANRTFSNLTVRNCYFSGFSGGISEGGTTIDNANTLIENCIFTQFAGNGHTAIVINSGGAVIRNCTFTGVNKGVSVGTLNAGQFITVNNCTFNCVFNAALNSPALGYIVEDYNNFSSVQIARSNVNVGAHSLTYYSYFDTRWFHEMVNGGSMLTPFDLASYSQLINVAGTSPTAKDIRGTAKIGAEREWGAFEYDSTLDIEAGSGGGGSVKILPLGRIGL